MAYFDKLDLDPTLIGGGASPEKPKPAGFLRSVADLGIEAASGVARGVKATADAFGADNAVSRGADTVDKFAREYLSAAAKADDQRVSEIMAAAQDAGVWEQVKAAAEAFTVKPAGMVLNAFGTSVPTIAAAMIPGVGQAGVAARLGALGAMGAAQGAGAVKGSIYEAVKAEQIKAGASESEAEAAAVRAQEYGGENTANIAGGAALGAAASATGVQPVIAKLLQRGEQVAAEVGKRGILQRALNPEGLLARTGMGALKEAPLEAAQGGQEQYASNIALQNEGFDTPAFRGVAGAAALEGLASAGPGAAFAALDKPATRAADEPKPDPVAAVLAAPDVDTAIKAMAEGLTGAKKPAPAELPQMDAEDRREVLGLMQVVNRPGVSPNVARFAQARMDALLAPYRSIPTGEATEMLPVADARELSDEERAEYANAAPFSYRRAMERGLPQPEVTELIPAGDATEVEPIPAGDAFEEIPAPEAYETLPTGEVSDLIPTADATEFEAVPAGEAAELDVETIRPTDLMAKDGEPFTSKTGAQAKAYASGGGKVVAIPNHFGSGIPGYVVRPLMQARPNNTRGTDARDLPRSSNDDQRDLAGSAEQVPGASDGRGADAARSGGAVGLVPAAPGRVDQPAEAPSTGNRPADVVAGAGDADTALTPGSRVTLNGTPYTVTTVNGSAVKLQGADGSTKMVARNSKTFGQIQPEAARETIIPANDKYLGDNDEGVPVYERQSDGFRYRLRDGRVQTGGILFTTQEREAEAAEREAGKPQEPNEAARPQAQAAGAEGTAPAAAPAPAAPAVVPGAGPATNEAGRLTVPVRTFGSSGYQLTMAQALAKVKELEADARRRKTASTKAPTAIMRGIEEDAASRAATLARKLREDIKQTVSSYPDARAEYAQARKEGQPASGAVEADGVAFDDELLSVARRETQALQGVFKYDLEEDAQGVLPGKPRMLDRRLARGDYTEQQIADEYRATREMMRARYGDTVTLWRADAPDGQKNQETRTVYMADEATAKKFATKGRTANPYRVKVDDVLAVFAKSSGYYEAVVRKSALEGSAAGTATPNAEAPVQAAPRGAEAGTAVSAPDADDYLTQLFGTPAEQAASQDRLMAGIAQRKQDTERIRDAIGTEKKRAQADYDDWSSRTYKRNKTQVDLQGDGPSNQGSMSIGAINESRRRNAMEALSQELKALDKLGAAVATDSGAEQFMAAMRDLYARAEKIAADGNGLFKTPGEQFQYMLLDDLKFRGPAGKGNVTSNGLSKAVLSAVKPEAAPAERTPKAQAVKEALAGDRQPFEHAGLKVYPTKMRRDGAVVDVWAVQLPENKGTDKVLGDTLHTTIDEAKKSAEYEAKRDNDRKEWARKEEADRADSEAKKEANRGKNITERAADFTLNQPNKLPPSAGLGTGTRREAMDKAVEQGRAIRAETVEDTAAKNRDKKAVEAVSKAGYLLGLSNENIPVVKAGLEARARLKADKYPKIEYRVYGGRLAEGPFHTITKIEYDYAVQRQAEQFAAEQDRPTPAPMDAATHKDPGEPAEPVTPAVVREAIKTGVQATDRKPSAMKADLLQQIDDAVKEAPDYPDFEALVKQRGDKEAREFFTMRAGVGEKAAPEGYSRPKRTFRVEGDGVFTVNNTVRQLLTFRASVESSPGFKDRQAPAGLTEKATTALDRRSTDAAIANMVDEGDFQAALDYAEAKGVDIGAVKLTKLLRDRLEKWQKDQASAKAVADYEAARAEGKPAPGSLAAAFAEKEAEPAPAEAPATADEKAPQLSEDKARQQFEWRNLGQKNGTKTHALFFYFKPEDRGTSRSMRYGSVQQLQGESDWRVNDAGVGYRHLAPAKFTAELEAIEVLKGQGFIKPAAAPADQAAAILNAAAEPPKGKERLDVLKDVKAGAITPEEVAAAFPPAGEVAAVEPVAENAPAAPMNTEDAGAELTYNKRNRIKSGIKWGDIASKNDALKIKEAVKQNVYPRPDYQALVDGGMQPLVAHLVKQVYDAIAAKPNTRNVPTDADLQTYIAGINRVMAGVLAWANDPASVSKWAAREARSAGAMLGKTVNLSELAPGGGKTMLDFVYPDGWKNNSAEITVIGSNKVLGALQPGYDEGKRAVKAVGVGWPAAQEAWEKRGIKIVNAAKIDVSYYEGKRSRNDDPYVSITYRVGDSRIMDQLIDGAESKDDPKVAAAVAAELEANQGMYLVMDKYRRIIGKQETEEAAKDVAREVTKREGKSGPDDSGIDVAMAVREGAPRRLPGEDISSDRLKDTYGLRGVNFGEWMKGNTPALRAERQAHLNHAYDSFADLAEVLGVPAKAMSLNGMLGLAIGAQGNGRYAAHFVPGVNEINLTRTSGAGSLAHEFGHALDHYFATQAGFAKRDEPYLTEHTTSVNRKVVVENGRQRMVEAPEERQIRPELVERFKAIVQAMNKKPETLEQFTARQQAAKDRSKSNVESWLKGIKRDYMKAGVDEAALDAIAGRILALDLGAGKVMVSPTLAVDAVVDELRALYRKKAGRVPPIDQIKGLQSNLDYYGYAMSERAGAVDHVPQQVSTDYAIAAAAMDKEKGGKRYWSTNLEKFARAFDAFVSDELEAKAAKNTYLSHAGRTGETVPMGDERKAINTAIKALVGEVKTRTDDTGNVALFSRAPDARVDLEDANDQSTAASVNSGTMLSDDGLDAVRGADGEGLSGVRGLRDRGRRNAEAAFSGGEFEGAAAQRGFGQSARNQPGRLNARTGVPIADAEAVADAIRAAYPTGPQIVVLDDVRKAPEALLDQIRAVQAANTVEGAYYKGKIYLFPQNVADIARLMFVGAHHEIRHAGLDALFGKRKGALLLSIAMSNPKVADAARKKIADGVADSMVAATEEALADMPLEDMAKLNGWNKIVAAVRQWLRGMADKLQRNHPKLAAMIRPDEWTDNDVAALIRRAEDISRGGTVPARPGGAVFSREPGVRAALDRALAAKEAFDAYDRKAVQVENADEFFALSEKATDARDALAAKLLAQPDDAFALQGRTSRGRMVIVNGSAQNPGQWQLTRFDGNDEPWGDSQYRTKESALTDFLREIDLTTLQDMDGMFSRADQTQTPAFRRWFGDSKVVDAQGKPLRVYHGTRESFDAFDPARQSDRAWYGKGFYFAADPQAAGGIGLQRPDDSLPSYESLEFSASFNGAGFAWQNQQWTLNRPLTAADTRKVVQRLQTKMALRDAREDMGTAQRWRSVMRAAEAGPEALTRELEANGDAWGVLDKIGVAREIASSPNVMPVYLSIKNPAIWPAKPGPEHDGIHDPEKGYWIAFKPEQIKSAIGNSGAFDPASSDIRFSRAGTAKTTAPDWITSGSAALQGAAGKIDTYAPQKTMAEKAREMSAGWKQKMVQGMFDAYAPLKALSMDAYIAARMTKAADGAFEGMLMYGKPVMQADGGITGDLDGKGFLGAMRELAGEHDRFFMWLAGNRAERLLSEGKENLFNADEIAAMKALNRGTMEDGRPRVAAFKRALDEFNTYSKSVLDVAEKAGLIDGESRKLWEHDFYVPFYRMSQENEISGPTKIKGLVRQKAFERLKGGKENLGDLMDNTLRNWSHLLSASLANVAASKSLLAAEQAGVAFEAKEAQAKEMAKAAGLKGNATYFMDQGMQRWFVVEDPAILQAVSAMEAPALNGLPLQLMAKFKKYLTVGVTIAPAFKVRNLIRDTLAAPAANEMSFNIAKNLSQGWKATDTKTAGYAQMLFSGGLMRFGTYLEGDRAEHVKWLISQGVDDKTILNTPQKVKAMIIKAWDAWQDFGDRMENVNRTALYQQLLDKGLSPREAAFQARDMMDFSLQGSWAATRTLTAVVPFLNARMQGIYKLGRAAADNPKRMGYMVGAVALASITLMLAYQDDDDWKAREDWDRDAWWWFKIGDTAYRIPKPFEIGAMGTIAERSVELLINDEMTGKRFAERMKQMVTGTFAINPVPQMFKPMLDLYANKDSFTGRQIETLGMERLSKQERYGPNTSALAKALGYVSSLPNKAGLPGENLEVSPVQADHLIRAYFGWLGTMGAATVDAATSPFSDIEKPTKKVDDYFGGFVKELPAASSRYLEDFYKQAKETSEAMADLRRAREVGDTEAAAEIMEERGDKVAQYRVYQQAQRQLADLNKRIRIVRGSTELDADAKRLRLDELTELRNRIARQVNDRMRAREAVLQ